MIPEDKAMSNNKSESVTFPKVKKLYATYPDDAFVQALMESTPPAYHYHIADDNDDDLLYDTLKEKYDL